jgi:predicted RNA binding protein YcfA (HicA-like mRNA interferase family)
MGQLSGFRYRDIVQRLKSFGFSFLRQAAGSHEIWFNKSTGRYTTIPNHTGDMPQGTLRAILMLSSKVVTPVKTGVQCFCNPLKSLDSGFHRNDDSWAF